jgi:hypothetical protein
MKNNINNTVYIVIGAVVLFLVGGLIGSSVTGNNVFDIFRANEEANGVQDSRISSGNLEIRGLQIMTDEFYTYTEANIDSMSDAELRATILFQSSLLEELANNLAIGGTTPDASSADNEAANPECETCYLDCFDDSTNAEAYETCKSGKCCQSGQACEGSYACDH